MEIGLIPEKGGDGSRYGIVMLNDIGHRAKTGEKYVERFESYALTTICWIQV